MMRDNPYFCRFTFGQFFALFVLEVFTLFFVFYLGAKFGDELFAVRPASPSGQMVQVPVSTVSPELAATTKDPEIQALAKELVAASPTPDLKQRVSDLLTQRVKGELTPQVPTTSAKEDENLKTREQPSEEMPPGEGEERGRYAVQIGSYPDLPLANDAMARWKVRGYEAYLVPADIPGKGRWYRIRLGDFRTKAEAGNYLKEFQSREKVDALVVLDE